MKENKGAAAAADGWEILKNTLYANPALKRKVLNHIKKLKKEFADNRKKAVRLQGRSASEDENN